LAAFSTLVSVKTTLPFLALLILIRVIFVWVWAGLAFIVIPVDLSVFSVCFFLHMLFFPLFLAHSFSAYPY